MTSLFASVLLLIVAILDLFTFGGGTRFFEALNLPPSFFCDSFGWCIFD